MTFKSGHLFEFHMYLYILAIKYPICISFGAMHVLKVSIHTRVCVSIYYLARFLIVILLTLITFCFFFLTPFLFLLVQKDKSFLGTISQDI